MRSQRTTSCVLSSRTGNFLRGLLPSLLIGCVSPLLLSTPVEARDDGADMLRELNLPWKSVPAQAMSATRIFTAYLDLTKPPVEIGEDFNQTTIWPGMENFEAVSKWAEANSGMGKALEDVRDCKVIGVPYGTDGVEAKFVERGLYADVTLADGAARPMFPYLKALETIGAYVTADMYRHCEAGRFAEAFRLGVAWACVLRQGADAMTFDEKSVTMRMLCESLSVQRDMMWAYREAIPADLYKQLGRQDYREIRPQDQERLRRLTMPEGDRIIGEAILKSVFDSIGQPDSEKFAPLFASRQSEKEPLTSFGAARRWSKIAGVHGSLEASTKKLNDIYDDWWRRWRMRPYDEMMALATEHSRTNPVKYAAVLFVARDVDELFELRRRLSAELCGTILSAGLCGFRAQNGSWPSDIQPAYQFSVRGFDIDPYNRTYGRFVYDYLGNAKRPIDGLYGLVEATGCVLYAVNGDGESNKAVRHAEGGVKDDFVLWPPLRAISRGQGE